MRPRDLLYAPRTTGSWMLVIGASAPLCCVGAYLVGLVDGDGFSWPTAQSAFLMFVLATAIRTAIK